MREQHQQQRAVAQSIAALARRLDERLDFGKGQMLAVTRTPHAASGARLLDISHFDVWSCLVAMREIEDFHALSIVTFRRKYSRRNVLLVGFGRDCGLLAVGRLNCLE